MAGGRCTLDAAYYQGQVVLVVLVISLVTRELGVGLELENSLHL